MELRRLQPTEPPKLKEAKQSPGIISGYALIFNSEYSMGWHREKIAPLALMGADMKDVRCYLNHDRSLILGRNKAGTLKLGVDKMGLWYECILPQTYIGEAVREAVRRGDISQSSWAFILKDGGDTWERPAGKPPVRVLTRVAHVFDVSPVSEPANPAATVMLNPDESRKSFERWEAKQTGKQPIKAAPNPMPESDWARRVLADEELFFSIHL